MSQKVEAPAKMAPVQALAYGSEGQDATFVTPTSPLPVGLFDENGNPASPVQGNRSDGNSTSTLLGANEEFIGQWETDNYPQVAFNVKADQPGTLYLELSPDDGTTITTSIKYQKMAGESRFDALVKMPGRAFRIRYVNGPTPQALFVLLAATGDGLYPYKTNDRDLPVGLTYSATVGTGEELLGVLVDLSDNINYPHRDTGSIDLYSSFIFADKASNTVGVLQFGVVTRIDETSADIDYIQGVSFSNSSDRQIARDRVFIHPFRLSQTSGKFNNFLTLFRTSNVTAVNTSTPIPSALGVPTVPGLGDLIIRYLNTSGGPFTGAVTIQYSGNVQE